MALAYPSGTSNAAPTPCTARPAINIPPLRPSAHTVEPRAKMPAPTRNGRRRRVGDKTPEEVVVLEAMPLNPTGEIDRVGFKRMAEDHLRVDQPMV